MAVVVLTLTLIEIVFRHELTLIVHFELLKNPVDPVLIPSSYTA